MNIKLIKNLILIKYGTYTKCAKALCIAPSTLTRNLQKPSYKFLLRLRDIGITIPEEEIIMQSIANTEIYNTLEINEEDLLYKLKLCFEENKLLKAEIYDLKKKLGRKI